MPEGPQIRGREDRPEVPADGNPECKLLERTEWNVRDSDATVIFTLDPKLSTGSKRTMEFAEKLGKPCRHFRPGVDVKFLRRFLDMYNVKILNVAGPRASNAPGIVEYVTESLDKALLESHPSE